jgi:hypothetical protein
MVSNSRQTPPSAAIHHVSKHAAPFPHSRRRRRAVVHPAPMYAPRSRDINIPAALFVPRFFPSPYSHSKHDGCQRPQHRRLLGPRERPQRRDVRGRSRRDARPPPNDPLRPDVERHQEHQRRGQAHPEELGAPRTPRLPGPRSALGAPSPSRPAEGPVGRGAAGGCVFHPPQTPIGRRTHPAPAAAAPPLRRPGPASRADPRP